MGISLPASFLDKMQKLLQDDFDNFMSSYESERYYGLRVNELKIDSSQWQAITPFSSRLQPIPWTNNAFYYEEGDRPGKHPHYHAGMYYIQEPSAMVPVELLDVRPGHRVLDLCAAPGGKSTQIASKLQGQGVLVSNDIAGERTKALAKNLELAGVRNAIVLNEEPQSIASQFEDWFDRILIDAPCSGEGMFRKNESMIHEWEHYSVARCSNMQSEILDQVAKMVAPGGKIVYSTCTFSPEENEEQIARFLARTPQFSIVPIEPKWGWSSGQSNWVNSEIANQLSNEQLQSLDGTIRLWPHRTKGEGHFVAVLQKSGQSDLDINESCSVEGSIVWQTDLINKGNAMSSHMVKEGKKHALKRDKSISKAKTAMKEESISQMWSAFAENNVHIHPHINYRAVSFGCRIYLQPIEVPSLDRLKVVRAGWYIGEIKNNKFIPAHSLAMGLTSKEACRVLNLSNDSQILQRYLKGETIFVDEIDIERKDHVQENGYILICVDNCPVGFGKYINNGMIKNEIPVGWRLI